MIWGGNFVIGRIAADYFPPITFSVLRWAIAFLLLTPFMIKPFKRDFKLLWRHRWVILLLSVTGVAAYNTIIYLSLHYTTSINASIVNSTIPLFIALFSVIILREKLTAMQGTGIILSVFGIAFILSKGSFQVLQEFSFNKGDLFVLTAVVCWSLYSVIIKKYSQVLPAFSTLYATSFTGLLILLPFCFYELSRAHQPILLTPGSFLILAYVALFASIVAFLSWNNGVSKVGASKAGIFLNLLPVFAVTFAILFTNEELHWYQLAGGFIVICGVILSSRNTLRLSVRPKKAVHL